LHDPFDGELVAVVAAVLAEAVFEHAVVHGE